MGYATYMQIAEAVTERISFNSSVLLSTQSLESIKEELISQLEPLMRFVLYLLQQRDKANYDQFVRVLLHNVFENTDCR